MSVVLAVSRKVAAAQKKLGVDCTQEGSAPTDISEINVNANRRRQEDMQTRRRQQLKMEG